MKKENYPKDFQEFLEVFKDEDACRKYLFEIRWPDGFVCPKCNTMARYWLTARNTIHCSNCGHQVSLTVGTIFQDTKKPLLLWFHIIWWVVAQKTGVSASNMKDFMGFGSYETVWTWLQKLRRAMVIPGRDMLSGVVEVDEIFIGGTHQGKVSPKYLPYYLDEFAFRFNRKLSTFRGKLFYRLIQQSVVTEPVPYNDIIGK